MLGILLVDKPLGVTSHDVVARVRRTFGLKRVGHAGTLDPMGKGLLVVAVGPATRFLQYLPLEPKEYEGELTFGVESTTMDSEGELSEQGRVPKNLDAALKKAIPKFLGLIEQLPPMHSAVKVAGRPLYKYARQGEVVPRRPRAVHIESIEVLTIEPPRIQLRVVCSGGTYMRVLAADLGSELGCGGYLSALTRTGSGKFRLEDAINLDALSEEHIIPLEDALPPMAIMSLNHQQAEAIRQGKRVGTEVRLSALHVALREGNGAVFGVAKVEGNQLQPECVLPIEAIVG